MPLALSIARRWRFVEDVEQAALLGLHLADVTAAPSMPEGEFRAVAWVIIRNEVIDHLRRASGRLRGKSPSAFRELARESVAMAVEMGLMGGHVSREPNPEVQAAERESERLVAARIDALPARSRDILLRRMAGEHEPTIARDYAITIQRVSQICWAAARSVAAE